MIDQRTGPYGALLLRLALGGLFISHLLRYVPQYVLTQEQADGLARGAIAKITGNAPGR
jgi:hypothetical protein